MNQVGALVNKFGFLIHPILFGLFPLISFYGANQSEIEAGNFSLSAFFIFNLAVAAIAWLAGLTLTRSLNKASLLAVVILFVFFIFGRVHNQLHELVIKLPGLSLGPTKLLLLISIVIIGLAWLGLRKLNETKAAGVNKTLNLISAIIVLTALFPILASSFGNNNSQSVAHNSLSDNTQNKAVKEGLPDIYYVVLDGYARSDYLETKFDHDNNGFLNSLGDRGFYVADKANSNYAHTHFSVASTFNYKYLNYLTEIMGEESVDRKPLRDLTQNNEAIKTFKSLGYKYVNIGSQWGWTESNPNSDIEVEAKNSDDSKILNIKLDEFAQVYLQTTAIKPWISTNLRSKLVNVTLGAFEKTEAVAEIPDPTFSFTHIVSPHPPYLFDENGIIDGLTKLELDNHGFSDREKFADQTIFVNKRIVEMVDNIMKYSSRPPIIVIASDHGPASGLSRSDFEITDPAKFNVEGIKERMAILNAFYFPDQNYEKLYTDITPVNTFRVILNQYFDQNYELLEDKSYFSNNKANEYRMIDVTEMVKH